MNTTPTMSPTPRRQSGLVGPIVLIGAGIVLLLNNFGILGWEIWEALFRLWPLILIAAGLDILIGRRSIWGSLLVAAVFLALLAGGLYYLGVGFASGQPLATEQISQGLEGAMRAEIELSPGVGNLRLASASESAPLLAGSIALDEGRRVTRDFRMSGDTAYLTLRETSPGFPFFPAGRSDRRWDLRLTRDIPIKLRVRGGVGNSTLDLLDARVTELSVNVGIGSTTVMLPEKGPYTANIDGGIGNLTINIPQNLAVRIRADTGLGVFTVSDGIPRQGDFYLSPGFDTAQNRAELRVSGGIGNVKIQTQFSTQ